MIRPFLAAVQFLTVVPAPGVPPGEGAVWGASMSYFPIVGLLIGAALAALDYGLSFFLPPLVSSVLDVAFLFFITGGLHMDGLADSADGLFSSRSGERMLEIMRDSRSGPMAAAAVALTVLLKTSVLFSLPAGLRRAALLLTPLAGRCALVVVMGLFPYVRPEGGTGTPFQIGCTRANALWASLFLLAVGWLSASLPGLLAAALSLSAALTMAYYIHSKIRGYTGDTLGAVCEIVEIMPSMIIIAAACHAG